MYAKPHCSSDLISNCKNNKKDFTSIEKVQEVVKYLHMDSMKTSDYLLFLLGYYMNYILSYLGILVSLGLLDYVWLWIIMKDHVQKWLWWLMKSPIDWIPAIGFYVLYSLSVLLLIVLPQSKHGTLQSTVLYGALLGFTAYMTYDLTNRATLKNWPVGMVIPDILWWAVVTGIVSAIWFIIYAKLS